MNKEKHNLMLIPSSLLAVSIWLIISSLAEYLLTEYWYVYNRLPDVYLYLFLLIIVFFTAYLVKKKLAKQNAENLFITLFLSVLVLIWTLFGYRGYQQFYNELQTYPKVYSISKNWSIQGDRLVIIGRNFGPAWKSGTVKLGQIEYMIVLWTDKKIVVEQPVVAPQKGKALIITNYYGKQARIEDFEIKDPTEVL